MTSTFIHSWSLHASDRLHRPRSPKIFEMQPLWVPQMEHLTMSTDVDGLLEDLLERFSATSLSYLVPLTLKIVSGNLRGHAPVSCPTLAAIRLADFSHVPTAWAREPNQSSRKRIWNISFFPNLKHLIVSKLWHKRNKVQKKQWHRVAVRPRVACVLLLRVAYGVARCGVCVAELWGIQIVECHQKLQTFPHSLCASQICVFPAEPAVETSVRSVRSMTSLRGCPQGKRRTSNKCCSKLLQAAWQTPKQHLNPPALYDTGVTTKVFCEGSAKVCPIHPYTMML